MAFLAWSFLFMMLEYVYHNILSQLLPMKRMKKFYIPLIILFVILILILVSIFLVKLSLSGYFTDKTLTGPEICGNLKEDEKCVCEKYSPPICHVEK